MGVLGGDIVAGLDVRGTLRQDEFQISNLLTGSIDEGERILLDTGNYLTGLRRAIHRIADRVRIVNRNRAGRFLRLGEGRDRAFKDNLHGILGTPGDGPDGDVLVIHLLFAAGHIDQAAGDLLRSRLAAGNRPEAGAPVRHGESLVTPLDRSVVTDAELAGIDDTALGRSAILAIVEIAVLAVQVDGDVLAFARPDLLPVLIEALGDSFGRQLHGDELVVLVGLGLLEDRQGERGRVGLEGQRARPEVHLVAELSRKLILAVPVVDRDPTLGGRLAAHFRLGGDRLADLVAAQHIQAGSKEGVVTHQGSGEVTELQVEITTVCGPGGFSTGERHLFGAGRCRVQIRDLIDRRRAFLFAGKQQREAKDQ